MKTSPVGSLQRRLSSEYRKRLTPDRNSYLETECKIVKVYDSETERYEYFPDEIKAKLIDQPGLIWCLVELKTGSSLYAPFMETPDQVYSTYGNSAALENSPGRLRYRNYDIRSGVVIPTKFIHQKTQDVGVASYVADIGGIIGI